MARTAGMECDLKTISKNNHHFPDTTISIAISTTEKIAGGTFGHNDLSYCDDPEDASIDESFMPVELRGKKWKTKRVLGEGGNFKVYLVASSDGLKYAMRWCRKQDCSTTKYGKNEGFQLKAASFMEKHLENTLRLKELIGHHPNIVKLIGFRKVNLFTQQIMEYIDGSDLHNFIEVNYFQKKRQIGIRKAQSLFCDLLSAVKHSHSLNIAHMDIKVENCLITRNGNLKLTDFDNAVRFQPGKKMNGSVYATRLYAAPETFNKEYKPACADIWACGIVLFIMLKQSIPWEVAK
uniref:Protein kinase domain-containing protein n=1 Tax=Elaeophora elaphi TaxID=1147741 RepID=A0A0R3RH30_9BILA